MQRVEAIEHIVQNFSRLKRNIFGKLPQSDMRELTHAQMQILMAIAEGCERISDIADSLHMTGSAVTQHVNQLVAKAYVSRSESAKDRREAHVSLSDYGASMLEQRKKQFFELMAKEMALLSDAELETLATILSKINTKR